MVKPPKHTYTPKQYKELIDDFIAKCKDEGSDYIACPEQLYMHTGLSKSTISEYKTLESNEAYREDTERAYKFIGIEGWRDLKEGNGRMGQNIIGRVLKYSEKTITEHEGQQIKVVMPMVSVDNKTLEFNVGE